jgi:hypothetical protein
MLFVWWTNARQTAEDVAFLTQCRAEKTAVLGAVTHFAILYIHGRTSRGCHRSSGIGGLLQHRPGIGMPLRAYNAITAWRRPAQQTSARQSCSLARRETDARPFARAMLQLSGPGRAPVKFPTPFQWRTSISFREPLLIDQYLPALAFHLSGTSDLRCSPEHATRHLQGFHHGGLAHRAQCAQFRCGRAHAGTVMDGRGDAPITKFACSPLQSHAARAAIGLGAQARLQIPSMRKQTRDRLTAAACEGGWVRVRAAPRPFLALPSSRAASSQAVRECRETWAARRLPARRLPGPTPRPACLPRRCWPRFFPDPDFLTNLSWRALCVWRKPG